MDPATQFLLAVVVVPAAFGVVAWSVAELRGLRADLDDHQKEDRTTFQTKDAAENLRYNIDRRLETIERDVKAIRQAVAPLPHQGGH